ncbi:hypothetical protein OG883_35255 [Streptomyces sp. NBC_01142]|uniref:hypothetical protein n=1 Tax=Streptomyces sp. NBC_01142 TaxID=2975865 RepID=UPI00224CF30E|nr:hypothetical protein [Streptomyces sp. NBC_01142]MCX4825029.1 hypothetical protein [Streptomyces sp. NBC_01142]
MGWIIGFAVILAPSLIGLTFAVRTARRVGKAERAMRVLAARPGWQRIERGKDGEEWAGYAGHFPWLLRTRHGITVTGPLSDHQVTVDSRYEQISRRDQHWLIVCFDLRGSGPNLRLERHWSAAELNLTFPKDLPYLTMSDDSAGTAERFYASDLPKRLVRFAGPAVSFRENGACFVYPLPEIVDLDKLLEELAGLLPDLAALARDAAREDEADNT